MGRWADTLAFVKDIPVKWVKTLINVLHVAANWDTISNEFKKREEWVRATEEWARAMLKRQGELHELDRKRLQLELEEKTAEWQKLAEEAVTVGKQLGARFQETRARFEAVFSDLADTVFLVALVLSYEEPRRRDLLLSTLRCHHKISFTSWTG